jgi:uncharacterized protein YjbJ (UPF0337 family)
MKAIPWILAGTGIGAFLAYVILNQPKASVATGYDAVEGAAREAFHWGTKQEVSGKGQSVLGAVKEGFGQVTGDKDMVDEGAEEHVVGDVKDAAGKLGHAVGETIHDLNI